MTLPTKFVQSFPLRALIVSLGLHGLLLWPVLLLLSPGAGQGGGEVRVLLRPSPPILPAATPAPAVVRRDRRVEAGDDGQVARRPAADAPGQTAIRSDDRSSSAPAKATEGLDAEELRGYRMALATQASRYWQYPETARRAGQRGTVEVRLLSLPGGISTVSLERSSGHEVLDEAALRMVRQAALAAPLPESLLGREFALVIPLRFDPD